MGAWTSECGTAEAFGLAYAIAADPERTNDAVTKGVVGADTGIATERTSHRRSADGDQPVGSGGAGAAALGDSALLWDGHARPALAPVLALVARAAGAIGLSLAWIAGWRVTVAVAIAVAMAIAVATVWAFALGLVRATPILAIRARREATNRRHKRA